MKLNWKQSALQSLIELNVWRQKNGFDDIGEHLVNVVENYFAKQDLSVYIPGRIVAIKGVPIQMRMALISVGKSHPYKVFYSFDEQMIEIFLVRHPHQKSLVD